MKLPRTLAALAALAAPLPGAPMTDLAPALPAFTPITVTVSGPRPDFWKVRPAEIEELCRNARRGKAEIIARTPGGRPVYALFYGDFNDAPPQTNWSAGASSSTWKAYAGHSGTPQTVLFCAGIHGAEAESVAAAVNLIRLLETGTDFRGKSDPELLELAGKYRLIILPCVNMDGRALSPDHLRGASFEDFRAASQGRWKDGSLIGWRGSKEFFPLPLDRVEYPGGYPNGAGINIMHDATPGDVRSEEARALLALCARHRVDLVLNGHSCEYAPVLLAPSVLNYPANVARGIALADQVNRALTTAGLRPDTPKLTPSKTLNLNTLAALSSGAIALTLECSVSFDHPQKATRTYSFEELMEPNFIMLRVILLDGLRTPFVNRATL